MLIYKNNWTRISNTDKMRWLMGAILELSDSIGPREYYDANIWLSFARSLPELEEYFHKLEEKS